MPTRSIKGPTLPRSVLDEINESGKSHKSRKPFSSLQRKERRRLERQTIKANRHVKKPFRSYAIEGITEEDEDEEDWNGLSDEEAGRSPKPSSLSKSNHENFQEPPTKRRKTSADPEPGRPRVSRHAEEKLARDDDEITRLEKKLGIKSKKLPKSFDDEGLGGLLGDLDDVDESLDGGATERGRKDDDEWLRKKRERGDTRYLMQLTKEGGDSDEEMDSDDGMDTDDIENGSPSGNGDMSSTYHRKIYNPVSGATSDDELSDGNNDDDDGDDDDEPPPSKPKRENPYVPPVPSNNQLDTKYVPPALRNLPAQNGEDIARLRRQVQGSLNKLAESNMMSIVSEMERYYAANARQHVHSSVIDLLLALICDAAALRMNDIALHAAFIAALHRVMGADFGAQCLERIVDRISEFWNTELDHVAGGKQALNLFTLLAHLFNFNVITSSLIFEYIRTLLNRITESHAELLLRIVRSCGHQLRQEDPTSLKEIAMALQKKTGSLGENNVSFRTRTMVEELSRLKDNHAKQGRSGVVDMDELITRYRKVLGTLNNNRTLRGSTQPLSLSIADTQQSDKRGKWWLVGARRAGSRNPHDDHEEPSDASDPTAEPNFAALAKTHNMSTPVQRTIFITLLTSTDHVHAYHQLLKLNLTRSQERQIPPVLLHCVSVEPTFNPYYLLVARALCATPKQRTAFAVAFTDVLKRLGAGPDAAAAAADEATPAMSLTRRVNVAKFFAGLLLARALPITVLRPVRFRRLAPAAGAFVEVLLTAVLRDVGSEGQLREIVRPAKSVAELAGGLAWFVRRVVVQGGLVVDGEKARRKVRRGCEGLERMLREDEE